MNINDLERESITLASIKLRFFAFIIDYVLISLIVVILYWNVFDSSLGFENTINVIVDATIKGFIIKFIYEAFFVYQYGATVGKILMKIRIIRSDNFDELNLLQSIARSGIKLLNEYILYFGCALAFANELKQTLHDLSVKSIVINAK